MTELTYYQKNREKIRAQQRIRHQQRKLEDPEYMEKRRASDKKYHVEGGGKEVRDAYNKKFQEDGIKVKIEKDCTKVKGPNGELEVAIHSGISVSHGFHEHEDW